MRTPEFWTRNDFAARLAVAALAPLGWIYGASVRWKAASAQPYRPHARVICVGNLTAGGSGKTPIAIAIARMLIERNLRAMFLTRGYGGRMRGPAFVDLARDCAADTGDEALLLAAAAPVIVSANREAGARLADAERADVIVMDDGHQNFSIAERFVARRGGCEIRIRKRARFARGAFARNRESGIGARRCRGAGG